MGCRETGAAATATKESFKGGREHRDEAQEKKLAPAGRTCVCA